jgi:hypothetical protein
MVNVNHGDIKSIMMFPEEVDYVTSLIYKMFETSTVVVNGAAVVLLANDQKQHMYLRY